MTTKLTACEAKEQLQEQGITFHKDFFELTGDEVDKVLAAARAAGYRKRKDAPGSTARMYYQYLSRKHC